MFAAGILSPLKCTNVLSAEELLTDKNLRHQLRYKSIPRSWYFSYWLTGKKQAETLTAEFNTLLNIDGAVEVQVVSA